jgi:hypothetical protein
MSAPTDAIEAALDRASQGSAFEFYRLGAQTDAERATELDAARAPKPTVPVGEQLGAALEVDSITRGAVRHVVEASDIPTDENYVPPAPDTPEFKTLTDSIPPQYWPALGRARSARHAEFIKSGIFDEIAAKEKLEQAGWSGTAFRIGVSILDPVTLATTLLTGGSSLIMNGSRLARAAKLGAVAGAENVALEGALLGTHETKDVDDLYVALIGGIVAGGAIGSILPAAERAKLYNAGKDLVEGGTGSGKVANDVTVELDEHLSAGAAQASRAKTDLLSETPPPEVLSTPQLKGAEAKVRFDWYGQLAKSDNPYVRYLGDKLLQDPVGVHGSVQAGSAEEFASLLKRRAMTYFYRDANPALDEYLTGLPLRDRGEATNRFFEEVTAARRAGNFEGPVGRAAQAMQRSIDDVAAEYERFTGQTIRTQGENFVPRFPSAQKIDQLVTRFGNKQIETLFATAFARETGISAEIAQKVARGYIRNVRMRGAGVSSDFHIAVADRDTLAAMMKQAGISDDEIEQVTKALKGFGEKDESKAGKIARAKRRLSLDESVTAQLKDAAGNTSRVSVTDLFENDARLLTRMYVSSVGGHAALARAGITSPAEWERVLNNARLYASDRLTGDTKAVDREISKLEMAHSVLTGKPLLNYDDPVRALSFVARDWAYIAQSGAFGFAQASELGAVLATGGFRLVSESVPALKGMFKRAANGELTDDLAREIEDFVAPGTDAILHSTVSRFDSVYDEALTPRAHGILDKTEGVRHTLRKAAGYASGLTPITVALQRLSSRYIAQRVSNAAFDAGRGYSAARLASMGLDADMQKRVFRQIREFAIDQEGVGRTIKRLDLERWTDLDARDAFVLAVQREGQRVVLVPTLGASNPYIAGSEMGKFVTQFMTFALQAHSRILLHGLKHMDAERFISWSLGMSLAGMAYVARTQLEASARKDRDKFLRDRLTTGKIAAAAFNMSGFSALIPPVVDTALKVAPGADPVFSHGRTSGLGTSLTDLGSYPGGATVKGLGNAASALKDGHLTHSEYQNMQRLLPFARVLGVKQALDAMGNGLPER